MDEAALVDKFIEYRKKRKPIGEFAAGLLGNGLDIDALVKYAFKKSQNLPLGFVCEVLCEAVPEKYGKAKKRISGLAEKLYEAPKNWQYLYETLEDFVKQIVAQKVSALNQKWKVYSQYDAGQVYCDIKQHMASLQ
jgi:hypothetical protein